MAEANVVRTNHIILKQTVQDFISHFGKFDEERNYQSDATFSQKGPDLYYNLIKLVYD